MGDIRVELRFKNKRLWDVIQTTSGGHVRRFAEAAGCDYGLLLDLLSYKTWLLRRDNCPRLVVRRVAAYAGMNWEELFPPHLYPERGVRRSGRPFSFAITQAQLEAHSTLMKMLPSQPPSPLEAVETAELGAAVSELLDTLSPRDAKVLKLRYGLEGDEELTYRAAAKRLGCSTERVRQIQSVALRKLRHPARRDALKRVAAAGGLR